MSDASRTIRTKPRPRCLLCDSAGETLYQNRRDPLFGAPGTWNAKRCPKEDCGLIWLDPTPVEEDLHLAYQNYFTHDDDTGKSGGASQLRAVLYQIYRVGTSLPAALIGLLASQKRMSRMFLDGITPGKLLDVGCGDGTYLNRMRGLGWTVEGVDFDAKAITSAKKKYGLDLRSGDLASAGFPDNSFDAVTLSHVIEHVPDPIGLLTEAKRVLKPGGQLVVTTPNSGSYGHDTFRAHWFGFDPPRHLQLFSPKTLRETARRAGFQAIEASSTAANADIFIGGSCAIQDSANHRLDAHPRPNLARTAKAMRLQYREHLHLRTAPDSGEEAVLICRNKSP